MKKLLATTAVTLVALSTAASAQSVLERVLGQIDNSTNLASVNGTFANIAENIGILSATKTYKLSDALSTAFGGSAEDPVVWSEDQFEAAVAVTAGDLIAGITTNADGSFTVSGSGAGISVPANKFETREAAEAYAKEFARNSYLSNVTLETGPATLLNNVDGSITNVVDGINENTQQAVAGAVSATEWNMPTLNFGNMSTTALGAVNTGEITLGVNQAVDQAKTTSTGALSSLVDQLGGSANTGALVLNVASNMTGVKGSISNTMTEVNGTVGALSTTALGAVNTGTITSGVNAAVTGIIGGTAQTGGIAP
jgi:hypothetical protein